MNYQVQNGFLKVSLTHATLVNCVVSKAIDRIRCYLSRIQVQRPRSHAAVEKPERSRYSCTYEYNFGGGRMTARSVQGAETRLRMIQAAADLFHKQGVRATSPDDVIEASDTGKSQFYHYFKNKEGLVHEVLQTHLEAIRTGTAPLKYDIASWDDLDHWFRAHLELQKQF